MPDRRLNRHRRLTSTQRQAAEAALEYDLAEVRIHTGPVANALAANAGALAFAHGNHIVLGAAAERMSDTARDRVLAHELIHVVQQSAPALPNRPRYLHPEARGPPLRPMIRMAPAAQCWGWTDAIGEFAVDVGSAAYDAGADAVDATVEFAGDVADAVGDSLEYIVDLVAPGLWDLLTGGAIEQLGSWLCQGIDFVLGGLFGPLEDVDIMSTLETTFTTMARVVNAVKQAIFTGLSNAVGFVLSPIVAAMEWVTPFLETAQGMIASVSEVFSGAWDSIAVPALDLLETVGGAIWQGLTGLVSLIWRGVTAVKGYADWAWDELMDLLGVNWGGEGGVMDTLSDWASDAWDELKSAYEVIKEPLMIAAGVLLVLSPLGPIIILSQILPPLYNKIKWLVENWDKAEIVVEAKDLLYNDIIPAIKGMVASSKAALIGAASWLAGMLGAVAGTLVRVIGAFGGGGCVDTVDRILAHIDDQVSRFQTWAENGFAGLNEAVGAAFDAITAFFEPIFKFLAALIQVSLAPFTLPLVIVGAIWLLLPERLKPPVIKFVLNLIILAVMAVPTFMPGLFPLAAVLKAGLLGFLRHVASEEVGDERRVAIANKVAGIMTGSMAFIGGYAVGILQGLIEGIIDPFKLLFMLFDLIMKGVAVIGRVINSLTQMFSPRAANAMNEMGVAVAGAPPPVAGQKETDSAVAVAQSADAGSEARAPPAVVSSTLRSAPITSAAPPRERPVAANQPQAPAGAAPAQAANNNAAPMSGDVGTAADGPMYAPGPAEASATTGEEDMSLESQVSDEDIMANMSPATIAEAGSAIAGEMEFSADGLEGQMRAEVQSAGSSVRGLSQLLGDAWEALMAGAGRVGAMAAGWFLEFLELANFELGRKIGWLTGMILLELLIAYFTAGGYMVIKETSTLGARLLAYFLRFLDMGGAILGIMGKGLARLRGPVMFGLDAAAPFLSRFRFLDNILGRVRGAADWLFRFGDEIGAAADLARRGPVDDLAGRGALGATDDVAEGVARNADQALPATAASRADEALPTRVVEDTPAPARALDDAPAPLRNADSAPTPARSIDEATEVASDRAAREAMEGAGNRPPRQGLDEAADGSRRTVDDAATPTLRDDALRATEFPQAIGAARTIAATNDAIDTPIPIVMGQLLYLKRRYRWIDYFRATPLGAPGVYKLGMVASPETVVDGRYDTDAAERIEVAPGVFRFPGGRRRPPRVDPAPPPRDVTPDGDGITSDELLVDFVEQSRGTHMGSPDIPMHPGRTERHTTSVMNLANNRSFGNANEHFLSGHLDEGATAVAQRFDRVAEQVRIRPITGWDASGRPIYADYYVIADNVVDDVATGGRHILDAKTSPGAPLTVNQQNGYPLIAANGGRIESRSAAGLPHHSDLPPTPVSRAVPNVNLRDPNAPIPPGGLQYDLTPVPPARPVNNVAAPVDPARRATAPPQAASGASTGPRPAGGAARSAGETAQQAGERIGQHTARTAPPIDTARSVDALPDGTLRAARDPAVPTIRNPAAKLAELPEAVAAARAITLAGDAADLPIEAIMGQLMLLKGRYRWIDTFTARPSGARFDIDLLASRHDIALVEVDSIFLFHGTQVEGARALARAMETPGSTFRSGDGLHDLGQGLYLFDTPRSARTYAGRDGVILELELPLPRSDDIADIALRGFGRDGAPGAQRAEMMEEWGQRMMSQEQRRAFSEDLGVEIEPWSLRNAQEPVKRWITEQSLDPSSPFSRNIARGQLFAGTVPPGIEPTRTGFAFEHDVIQWRIKHPTEDMRRQIIEQVLGPRRIIP